MVSGVYIFYGERESREDDALMNGRRDFGANGGDAILCSGCDESDDKIVRGGVGIGRVRPRGIVIV